MRFQYIDAHTHAQFAAYDSDRDEVIKRALENGVAMINVGTQKDTSREAIKLARHYENVWATVGLHPIHTSKSFHDVQELGLPAPCLRMQEAGGRGFTSRSEEFDYEYHKDLALDLKVVAIGECGLDYFRLGGEEEKEKQKQAFIKQIELAHEIKKPLMIHCRDAFFDLINILDARFQILNSPPGIIHFFSGNKEEAQKLLDMGFYFTFGGIITFVRDYDEVIKLVPLDRILSETDAPYIAPAPYRGKRNEPLFVVEVVKKLAEIKNVSVEEMADVILRNAGLIFGLKLKSL